MRYHVNVKRGPDDKLRAVYASNCYYDVYSSAKGRYYFSEIISKENNTVMWRSTDHPELKEYEQYDYEEWETMRKSPCRVGMKEGGPSIYFDIDGTLGLWYPDLRGYTFEGILDARNHYFRDIEPHVCMVALAKALHNMGEDVCIVSASDRNCLRDKWEWIDKYLPFVPKENIFFCPVGRDKSTFVKWNAEKSVLIDDYASNLQNWPGIAMKAINTVNSHQDVFKEIDFIELEQDYAKGLVTKEDMMAIVQENAKEISGLIRCTASLDEDVSICKMCEVLADNPKTSHLASWCGDYAVYEPAVGVTNEEIREAYEQLAEEELER